MPERAHFVPPSLHQKKHAKLVLLEPAAEEQAPVARRAGQLVRDQGAGPTRFSKPGRPHAEVDVGLRYDFLRNAELLQRGFEDRPDDAEAGAVHLG